MLNEKAPLVGPLPLPPSGTPVADGAQEEDEHQNKKKKQAGKGYWAYGGVVATTMCLGLVAWNKNGLFPSSSSSSSPEAAAAANLLRSSTTTTIGALLLPDNDAMLLHDTLFSSDASSCTENKDDPYASGHILCCKGLHEVLKDWDGTGTPRYQCKPDNVGLLIINNCDEDIDLRTPDMSIKNEPDSNHQTIRKGESVRFEAGTVRGNKVVLAWMEAKDLPCHNGILCTQIELTTSNEYFDTRCHPNFVNQLAYTDMAIGVAFYKQGQPVQECPESTNPTGCRDGRQKCTSNAGGFDKCMHDVSQCNEDVGIKVQLQPHSAHHYCLSPDSNKAVISDLMTNPTKKECAMEMKVGTNVGDWVCNAGSDKCQDHSQDSTGTTGTLCSGVRYDIKKLIQNGLQLWNSATHDPLTVEDLENVNIGGAKNYQTAVNKACSNQPPTQRATDGANGPVYKAEDPFGQGTSRSYDQPGRLDHVLTYEGDDVNQWYRRGQEFEKRGIFMAGSAGIQCDKQEWDTFVIKACPAGSD